MYLTRSLLHIALAIGLCHCVGHAQNLDKELSAFAETLAKQVKASGKKKVSILDFSDLQGNFNELGRFVAEKLTVKMVSQREGYSMVDRANLKRILEEHKLTMSGLVDPDNAKKLGQLSGVDAIILGNVIPFKSDLQFTAKIIATDTAEIVGSGEGQVAKDEQVTELLGRGISSEALPRNPQASADPENVGAKPGKDLAAKRSFQDDNLAVDITSFRFLDNGNLSVSAILKNVNKTNPIYLSLNWVRDKQDQPLAFRAFVIDERGNKAPLKESNGIRAAQGGSLNAVNVEALSEPPQRKWGQDVSDALN